MSQQIREIWTRFEKLAQLADSADAKLIIAAIHLHAEVTNSRLGALPHEIAAILGRQTNR